MASDDSDVSAIALSDDDGPQHKAPALLKPALKAAGGAVDGGGAVAASTAAARGSSKAADSKSERRKGRVAFQLDEYDDEYNEGDNKDAGGGGRRRGYHAQDTDDTDADDDGAVEDESKPLGWSYFRKRDANEGPATWSEVDTGELRFVAESLVRSTTKRASSQADDVMQQIFQAAAGDADSLVADPLGRGVIDPVTLTLGKRSKVKAARLAQPSSGEKGLKATMRTFRTARLQQQQPGGGLEGGPGGSGQQAAAAAGSDPDEEARKVLPNQEGFDPEAYLAAFHAEGSLPQLEKGLRALSRELSERTGQLKLLIRNNFDRFINCKDAIDDIHAKMRKTLVRGGGSGGGGAGLGIAGGSGAGAGGAGAQLLVAASGSAASQQQQTVATDKVFRSLEQVGVAARRTFGPTLERAAKADRIRSVAGLLQRFDHLFAAPRRVLELAGRGELEQVVREYKRANLLIRPTPTTARVWLSLYAEIEKCVTEVFLAVKQLVTEPPPEGQPMGQDGPAALFGVPPATAAAAGAEPAASSSSGEDDVSRQRLTLLPDYLIFLALVRQERLPAAREEDPMRLYVSRLDVHLAARIQACDRQHVEQLRALVGAWMRSGAATGGGTSISSRSTSNPAVAALRAASSASGLAALQASFTSLPRLDAPAGGGGGGGAEGDPQDAAALEGADAEEEGGDLDDEGEAAEAAFLLWPASGGMVSQAAAAFLGGGGARLPYHIRTELRRLVQEPGGMHGGGAAGAAAAAAEPLPRSAHAAEPRLTPAQRQWVSYVCSVSAQLVWSLPGLWATCNSAKYGNNADLNDESREGLERGSSLARRLVESACTKYVARLRRAAQSLARAGAMQPGLPLIIKDACCLWSSLRRVGVGGRTLSALRGGMMSVLGGHGRVLAEHLGELPQRLFGADDFTLDLWAASDQQPVTQLPRRLEEEVGVAMLHYQWPLGPVVEAAGGVGDVPPESSWRPVQSSMFACFSLLSEALAEYARSLYGSHVDGGGGSGGISFRGRVSVGSLSTDLEASGSGASGSSSAQTPSAEAAIRRTAVRASGAGGGESSPRGAVQRRATDAWDGAVAASAEDGAATTSRGSCWSAGGGGGGSDDVRVLLVIGNSAVIRTRIVPGVVERFHKLLAPTPEAASTCQRRLRELTSAMRRSNEALGSSYLARKEAGVQAAVRSYMQAATEPLLPAPPPPPSNRSGKATAAVPSSGKLLAGPSGPSAGCCSLLQLLTAIHNEALAYSPSNLRSFMEALAERLVAEVASACTGLAAAAVAAAGSPSVEQLVQLWADLRFLTAALRPLLSNGAAADLREARIGVCAAIAARQSARRYRPASVPAAALADLTDGEEISTALDKLLTADVEAWLRLHALNVRCFAAASATTPLKLPPPSTAAATSTAGVNPGSGSGSAASGTERRAGRGGAGSDTAWGSSPSGGRELGGGGKGPERKPQQPR